jgi:hypothetical protein
MKKSANVKSFQQGDKDYLDELMDKEPTDEMGLLDLIFMEEILSQRKHGNAG